MSVNVPEQLFGFLMGWLTTLVFWWITVHGFVPHIQISRTLRQRDSISDGKPLCSVKIRNAAFRDAYETTIYARLFLKTHPDKQNYDILTLNTKKSDVNSVIPVLFAKGNRVINIYLFDSEEVVKSTRFNNIRDNFSELEECQFLSRLFVEFPGSYARIYLSSFDSWTGARKFYVSQRFMHIVDHWEWEPWPLSRRVWDRSSAWASALKTALQNLRYRFIK